MKLRDNIKGDLSGALTAAIITIPMSIGYGIIAFAPLGVKFAPLAALMGLYAAIFPCFIAALIGGTPIQITGPKAPLTLVLAGAVVSFAALVPEGTESRVVLIVALTSLCVFAGGIFQVFFGLLRLGNLVKYVPYPVIAGFMNGIAIILVIKQLKPLLGITEKMSLCQAIVQPENIQPCTLIVGLTTLTAIFLGKKHIKIIPSSIIGLLSGTGMYYFFTLGLGITELGPLIGKLHMPVPQPEMILAWFSLPVHLNLIAFLPQILLIGLVLGIIGTMESLLSAVVSDQLTGIRHHSNRELWGQGIGNMVGAFFGSLSGAGSIPRSMANFRAGGQTKLSGMMCAVFILLIVLIASPIIGRVPLAAIAGIIIAVAITMFDRSTLNQLLNVRSLVRDNREVAEGLLLSLSVTVVTVSVNLIAAVGIGMCIASALFIAKMGKSIIFLHYSGKNIHSKRVRTEDEATFLDKKGGMIIVFELQGPIFFGSADNLVRKIEKAMAVAQYCIFDMRRVNDIDSTGKTILLQLKKKLEGEKKHLLICGLLENSNVKKIMQFQENKQAIDIKAAWFHDTDAALEWAEDDLLDRLYGKQRNSQNVDLNDLQIVNNFSPSELEYFQTKLVRGTYRRGELFFAEGDRERALYILLRGSISIRIKLEREGMTRRLTSISPGVVFGELALLDGSARSTGAQADEDSEVLRLSYADYLAIFRERPEVANKLIVNIALLLTCRLRRLTNEVRELEN